MPSRIRQRRLLQPVIAKGGVTTRALEQWFAADYGVTSSGGLVSQINSRNGKYNYTSSGTSRPTLTTDAGGFSLIQFNGSSTNFTGHNQTMKDAGIEIAAGAEWHGVFAFPSTTNVYLMTLDPAAGEGRASLRGYRGGVSNATIFPEAGGTGGTSVTFAYGTNKVLVSFYRNLGTNTLGVGINGTYSESATSTATALARGNFNWLNPNGSVPNCNFYEGLGYVDNLTATERAATIAALKTKYGIS